MGKLTEKRRGFVQEYLIDLNATQAAIRAGYSPKTAGQIGEQLLKILEVQEYMRQRMAEKDAALIAKQDEVLQYLTSVLRGEQKEQVPMLCGDGCQKLEDKDVSAKDRLKAAELLGKRYNLFTGMASGEEAEKLRQLREAFRVITDAE